MKLEDFAVITETNKEFEEVVVSVLKAVEQKSWVVFNVYDIRERLEAKGFKHEPLKIIEICSGKHADRILNQDVFMSLCMPCKINIIKKNNKVLIASAKPTFASEIMPEIKKQNLEDIEQEIKEIINNSI
ncbi:DUF302 domain-containing protein [Candidatus Pacearchaeota archaeon]|nr:DUF302 domain-containing protein [Candidatus Pacearchaeota archaeon]